MDGSSCAVTAFNVWAPKKLCPKCALASHLRHNLESMEAMTDGRCVIKSLEGIRKWEESLDEAYQRKSEKYRDLLKPVGGCEGLS